MSANKILFLPLLWIVGFTPALAANSTSPDALIRDAEFQEALVAAPEPTPFGLSRGGECGDESAAGLASELRLAAKDLERRAGVPGLELVAALTGAASAGHGGICAKLNWLGSELERDTAFFRSYAPPMALAHERVSAALLQLKGQFGDLQAVMEPAAACFVKLMANVSPATLRTELTRCHALADTALQNYPKFQEAVVRLANGQIEVLSGQEYYLRRLASNPELNASQRQATLVALEHVRRQKNMFLAVRVTASKSLWGALNSTQLGSARAMPGVVRTWRESFFARLGQPRNVCLIGERDFGDLALGSKIVDKQTVVAEKEWSFPEHKPDADGKSQAVDPRGAGAVRGSHGVFIALWEFSRLAGLMRPSEEADSLCARRSKAGAGSKAP